MALVLLLTDIGWTGRMVLDTVHARAASPLHPIYRILGQDICEIRASSGLGPSKVARAESSSHSRRSPTANPRSCVHRRSSRTEICLLAATLHPPAHCTIRRRCKLCLSALARIALTTRGKIIQVQEWEVMGARFRRNGRNRSRVRPSTSQQRVQHHCSR